MYDADVKPASYLRLYAEEFDSVEIDSTFYGTPTLERVARWTAAVPADFRFALKVPREITHERRLVQCEKLIDEFCTAADAFGERLGCVLVQFPADFLTDNEPAVGEALPLFARVARVAVEFRDPQWYAPDAPIRGELARLGMALAVSDGPFLPLRTSLETLAVPTADFVYARWLGTRDAVARFDRVVFDRTPEIDAWAAELAKLPARVKTAFGYANNHYQGHAPATARAVYAALRLPHARPARVRQPSLFGESGAGVQPAAEETPS